MSSFARTRAGPVPSGTSAPRRERAVRPRVWWRRTSLDRQIAAGADPQWTPELARRAVQLASLRNRARVAKAIERTVSAAEPRRSPLSAAVPIRRRATRDAGAELLGVAGRLRGSEPVDPQGVALAMALLVEPASPIYVDGDLAAAVATVDDALDGRLR